MLATLNQERTGVRLTSQNKDDSEFLLKLEEKGLDYGSSCYCNDKIQFVFIIVKD